MPATERVDAARIHHWMFEEALPVWSTAGRDPKGGFAERLTLDGQPAPSPFKRMRVQARQVYVYAHAALMGWPGPAVEAADDGFTFMTEKCWHPEGGFVFSVDADGEIAEPRRETYEQAFAINACAWYHRAFGGSKALDWAGRTLDFLDQRLAAHNGGYRESLPADQLPRRQNPHMHLLEALMALHEATGDAAPLARAKTLIELFRERFFDPATGTLGEFYGEDWSPAPGDEGTHVEPGHHFEWVWLLNKYAELSGDRWVDALADTLYSFAIAHGVDADGLAYDAIGKGGARRQETKRLWPQNEALKAHLIMAERGADADAAARAERTVAATFAHYLNTGHGVWQDHLRPDRSGFAETAPASTLYHLFLAFSEHLRVKEG